MDFVEGHPQEVDERQGVAGVEYHDVAVVVIVVLGDDDVFSVHVHVEAVAGRGASDFDLHDF